MSMSSADGAGTGTGAYAGVVFGAEAHTGSSTADRPASPAPFSTPPASGHQSHTDAHVLSAMDCVIMGKTGVYSRALHTDMHSLVRSYEERDCIDFTTFSSIWRNRKYALVHFICGDANSREPFMSVLYDMLLDFLSPQETFTAQTGSIFALYLLYFTQPTVFKKVAIRLTIPAWQNLELLYQIAFDHDATDLIYVIHKLRDKGAFMYTAQNEKLSRELRDANTDLHHRGERTLIRMEKKINASPLVPVKPLLMDLPHIATLYREAKADLVALSLARRSSEMVMEHLSSLRPTDLDMRGVTPLPPFVKDRTVSAHPSVTSSVGQLYSDSAEGITGSLADKTVAAIHHPLSHRPLSVFEREQQQKQEGAVPAETVDYPMDTERDSTYTPRASRPEGDYPALGAISSRRGKKKRSLLPYVFPFSMLQASRADFLVPIENITRNYLRDRMVRLEFTTSGGLPRNDYQFPESSLMQGRNKPLELMPESEGPEMNGKTRKSERERRRRDQQKQERQRLKASQDRTRTREPQTPELEERESGINSAETGMREMIQEIPARSAGQEFQEHMAASAERNGEVGDILTQNQQPREEQDHRSTRDIAKDISPT